VLSTRDGIDIASLHLPAADAAVMQLLTDWAPVILSTPDQMWPGFGAKFRKMIAAASSVGLLSFSGTDPLSYLNGGRATRECG